MTGRTDPAATDRPGDGGKALRMLTSSVLISQAVVIWLAIPVAVAVQGRSGAAALALAALGLACALLPGVARSSWYVPVGWVLQVLCLASALLVPWMGVLGAIFLGLWGVAVRFGNKSLASQPGAGAPSS